MSLNKIKNFTPNYFIFIYINKQMNKWIHKSFNKFIHVALCNYILYRKYNSERIWYSLPCCKMIVMAQSDILEAPIELSDPSMGCALDYVSLTTQQYWLFHFLATISASSFTRSVIYSTLSEDLSVF